METTFKLQFGADSEMSTVFLQQLFSTPINSLASLLKELQALFTSHSVVCISSFPPQGDENGQILLNLLCRTSSIAAYQK